MAVDREPTRARQVAMADKEAAEQRAQSDRHRHGRNTITAVVILLAVPLFLYVTSFTGFPGPGFVRRYPRADLNRVAHKINEAYEVRSCDAPTDGPVASVDWLRARVRVHRPAHAGTPLHVSYTGDMTTMPIPGVRRIELTAQDLAMIENPDVPVFPPPGFFCGSGGP
jgi:hypothetical protein